MYNGKQKSAGLSADQVISELRTNRTTGLSDKEAELRLKQNGNNEIPEKKRHPVLSFLKKFWGLSSWMIELIALVSLILHKYNDFFIAVILLLVNATISFIQEERASSALASMRKKLQILAKVLRDGKWQKISASSLVCGDIIRVRAGDFIPADLTVIDGELRLDESFLSGESDPVGKQTGDTVYSGSTAVFGEANTVVHATGKNTRYGKTAQLIENARTTMHIEEVIYRIVRYLFIIIGLLSVLTFTVSLFRHIPVLETLPIILVLLMSAVPIALPVMFSVSLALGSMELSKQGVLITRLNAIEDAATMDILCSDKTGTLTMNKLAYKGCFPAPGFSEEDVLRIAAFASNEADADPLDAAVLAAAGKTRILPGHFIVRSFVPFSASTRRTEAEIETEGKSFTCIKGAFDTVVSLSAVDPDLMKTLREKNDDAGSRGIKTLAAGIKQSDEKIQFAGLLLFYDPPRADSRSLIQELRSLGIQIRMLTGDALAVGREIARQLGLGELFRMSELKKTDSGIHLIAQGGGFAEVFPEDKLLIVKKLQEAGHIVGMTGDGVNDAPALRQAEVGIAVSTASDIAKGAGGVVLTGEGLGNIVDLVKTGRSIYQRVLTWIINKIGQTTLKAGLVVFGFLVTGKFVISALSMILLVVLNDFAVISLSTDKAAPSQKPENWKIGHLVSRGALLGVLMLIESAGILTAGWFFFGLREDTGLLQTFTFLILVFNAVFGIISIRERRHFWNSKPSPALIASLAAEVLIVIIITFTGLGDMKPLPSYQIIIIILYSGICILGFNDWIKFNLLKDRHPQK